MMPVQSHVVSKHYNDVIMGTIASQIGPLTIVYSTVYSDANQRKHQSSASLAFVRGIHWWPMNSPHKWPVTWNCFHLMTSSWSGYSSSVMDVPESRINPYIPRYIIVPLWLYPQNANRVCETICTYDHCLVVFAARFGWHTMNIV